MELFLRTTNLEENVIKIALKRSKKREFLKQNYEYTTYSAFFGGQLDKGILEGKNHRKAADGMKNLEILFMMNLLETYYQLLRSA